MVLTHLFSTPIGNLGLFDSVFYSKSVIWACFNFVIMANLYFSSLFIWKKSAFAIGLQYCCGIFASKLMKNRKNIKNQELC